MGRAEAGTSKALDNKMKSKGLQKLRWYCQVCEKQCRDENGFKCHTQSEAHLRQMLVVGESAGKHIADYTSRFQQEFVQLLSRRWGTKRVRINQVYNEYIQDKNHLHMNATRFTSLTEFCKHLGRTGVAHVDENEKGWWVSWIDNSPRALARNAASQSKERADMDDEMRQRKLIQEQIERAREEGEKRRRERAALEANGGEGTSGAASNEDEEPSRELKRDEGDKVQLSLSFKTSAPAEPSVAAPVDVASSTETPAAAITLGETAQPAIKTFIAPPSKPVIGFTAKPNAFKTNPLKTNPLKAKSNPLKQVSTSTTSSGAGVKRAQPMSAVEQIMADDLARKQRRMA
ncbi:hypothetical protein OIO90_001522 [Microbotryomycetes sp. JL221]|nr:hypothetical protein OIO90_001522 [Microbotryomycetes sp. JL221]